MADVMVICSGCGAKVVASEFADAVTCRSCGKSNPVKTPATHGGAGTPGAGGGALASGLKLKDAPSHGTAIKPPADVEDLVRKVKERAGRGKKTSKAEWANNALVGWGVFIVLASLSVGARFGGILPPDYLEWLKTWGWAIWLAVHLALMIKAFEDSVFYGTLCLLIPPYSLYYLFALCDLFILRAIYLGVLAGVGWDTYHVLKWFAIETYIKVNSFILSGGG